MRNEDDRPAACRQAPDDLVEALDLRRGQRSGRLVEDDELGVPGKRPQDLDLLLHRERQCPDRRVRRHLKPAPATTRRNRRAAPAPNEAERRGSAPRNTFSATVAAGPARPPGRPLRSRAQRRRGEPKLTGRAQVQLALVLREHARDDLAERGLAGSVLADEGMNGAGAKLHRDLVQGTSATERLADPADVEVDLAGSHGAFPDWSARPLREREELVDVVLGHDAAVGQVGEDIDPGLDPPPARMASMNICVPSPPSVAGACITVP